MDKKDIYEHLAKIYLDASSKKKKKSKAYPNFLKNSLIIVAIFVVVIISALFLNLRKNKPFPSEIALVLLPDVAKINFHFDPARRETYTLDLNRLDLSRYKALAFNVKKTSIGNTIALKVEFATSFKEKSEVYFKDLPHKWESYKINFSDFKSINDWSEMSNLIFSIEEWNTKEKKGVVLLDNVRVLK